jgi:hypothetical protein
MSLLTTCPLGTAITDVLIDNCPSDVGQIQKIIFQRIYSTGTTRNTIALADAPLLAEWTPFFAASDGTKMQITPFVSAPTNELGAAITYGGGNDTVDGIPITTGVEPSKFECKLIRAHSKTAESLKGLYGETLGVYFVNEHGRIWGDSDDATTPTTYYPVQIRELFVSDRKFGGFAEPDYYMLSFNLPPNWSDKLNEIIPTDFDPLTALAN